jgi:hypothetical protein
VIVIYAIVAHGDRDDSASETGFRFKVDSGFKGADGAGVSSSGGKPVQFEREKEGDKDDVSSRFVVHEGDRVGFFPAVLIAAASAAFRLHACFRPQQHPTPPAPQVFGISAFFQEAKKGGSGGALDGIGAGGGMGFGAGGGGAASNRSKIDFEKGKK